MYFNNDLQTQLIKNCEICYESNKPFSSLCTFHDFCNSCLSTYLETNIQDGKVLSIPCPFPNCPKIFADYEIQPLISETLFLKYTDLYNKKLLERDIYFRWCPQKNCSGHDKKINSNKLTCCKCKFEFCFFCANKWHEGSKCPSDRAFSRWSKKNKTKKCPVCFSVVEKNGGCPHMYCTKCQSSWCWNCGKSSVNHDDFECVQKNNGFDVYWFVIFFLVFMPVTFFFALFFGCLGFVLFHEELDLMQNEFTSHVMRYKYFYLVCSFVLSPVMIVLSIGLCPLVGWLSIPCEMISESRVKVSICCLFSVVLVPLVFALEALALGLCFVICPVIGIGLMGYKLAGICRSGSDEIDN